MSSICAWRERGFALAYCACVLWSLSWQQRKKSDFGHHLTLLHAVRKVYNQKSVTRHTLRSQSRLLTGRTLMHERSTDRSGLNAIPLIEWYIRNPDDVFLLEPALGAVAGQMNNIDETGAGSMMLHMEVGCLASG